jgi:hypothetical protein
MDDLKQLLNTVLAWFQFDYQDMADKYLGLYFRRIVFALDFVETTLRDQLQTIGLPYSVQTILLVALPLLLAFAMFRALRGKMRLIAVLVFLVFAVHVLIPVLGA